MSESIGRLQTLRTNPESAVNASWYSFMVDSSKFTVTENKEYPRCKSGGKCTLTAGKTVEGVTRVLVTNGGSDYFFPWVNRGVGEVKVPAAAPDGTIVVTNGMNGCALEVVQQKTDLLFYHDADSCYLHGSQAVGPPVMGSLLCRITAKNYDRFDRGSQLCEGKRDGTAFMHQLLVVKDQGRWKVFACPILFGPGIDMLPKGIFVAAVSRFLDSFETS